MQLMENEKQAIKFFDKVGKERALKLLDMVCHRIERKVRKANTGGRGGFYFTIDTIKRSDWETRLIYIIKLGFMLNNTDTPRAAKERNLARRAQRKLDIEARNNQAA
ncbi:MAG: hypothetical protein HAW67_05345 [Endozoicomonadaceae bacterium]|nr:hypothetical protein [Endozoicomonadaceae bacterium]